MKTAKELYDEQNSVAKKEEKYKFLINRQEDIIKEAIKRGDRSRLFLFSDKEYYHGEIERGWYQEFYDRAKRELERAGYKISGICVTW